MEFRLLGEWFILKSSSPQAVSKDQDFFLFTENDYHQQQRGTRCIGRALAYSQPL